MMLYFPICLCWVLCALGLVSADLSPLQHQRLHVARSAAASSAVVSQSSSSSSSSISGYAVISPTSCPPTQPTGSSIGKSSKKFSKDSSGTHYLEYNDEQYTFYSNSKHGRFFIDLSDPDALTMSINGNETLVLHSDGAFEAFIWYEGACLIQVVDSWHPASVAPSLAKPKQRRDLGNLCAAIRPMCDSTIGSAFERIGVEELCDTVGGRVGTEIGALVGSAIAELPGGLVGAVLGKRLGTQLCKDGADIVKEKICDSETCSKANYDSASNHCTTSSGLGRSVFCCSGSCIDGGSIGGGLCLYWQQMCEDLQSGPPSCPSDQALQKDGSEWVDSGDGDCWGGDECQWQRQDWKWQCCKCNPGYKSWTGGQCMDNDPFEPCVGCNSGQSLVGDSSSGFYCV